MLNLKYTKTIQPWIDIPYKLTSHLLRKSKMLIMRKNKKLMQILSIFITNHNYTCKGLIDLRGFPSAISIAVMPSDQISLCKIIILYYPNGKI